MARINLRSILSLKNILVLYYILIAIGIYSPIISLIAFSFKSGSGISFPFESFSLRWYEELFSDRSMMRALSRSVQLSLATMVVTTILCLITALTLRKEFPGKDLIFYLTMLGIIVPGVIHGIGAALFYKALNIRQSLWTGVPIQVIWTLPWGLILMLARFDPQMRDYEEAARTLGANDWMVLRKVTLPLVTPELMSAALFAFILSFGEILRNVFVVSGTPTLPVLIFGIVALRPTTPKHFALGTVVFTVSFTLLLIATILTVRSQRK